MTTIINNTDFIKHFNTNNIPSGKLIIEGVVVINSTHQMEWNFRFLENITFKDSLCVNGVDIKLGLYFKYCTFLNISNLLI